MEMRIGLDIDGVIRGFTESVARVARKKGVNIPEDPHDYEYIRKIEVNGESIASKIWKTEEWLEDVFLEAPMLDGALDAYHKFVTEPMWNIYLVSAQNSGTEHLTDEWLEDHGFVNHFRTIYTKKKGDQPIQILVDDNPTYLDQMKEKSKKGIMVKRNYNKEYNINPKLCVNNLNEAYNLIKSDYDISRL